MRGTSRTGSGARFRILAIDSERDADAMESALRFFALLGDLVGVVRVNQSEKAW